MKYLVGSVTTILRWRRHIFQLMRAQAGRTHREPACTFFHVEQVADNPQLFIVAECDVDAAAHAAPDASRYMQEFMKVMESHLATIRINMIAGSEIEVVDT